MSVPVGYIGWSNYEIPISDTESWSGNKMVVCPRCSHDRKKRHLKCLSCNSEKLTWNCHHCGWSGHLEKDKEDGTYTVQKVSSVAKPEEKSEPKPEYTKPVLKGSKGLTQNAVNWFAERGISLATLEKEKITVCPRFITGMGKVVECIAFPYERNGELVNVKYRSNLKHFSLESGAELILYRFDSIVGQKEIYVTEGEMDALTLVEAGYENVVSVPNGAKTNEKFEFMRTAQEHFDNAERVIFVMDKDEIGLAYERAFIEKVGAGKSWMVKYPEDCKDINDVLMKHGLDEVKSCISSAISYPVAGIHSFGDFKDEIIKYAKEGMQRGFSTGWSPMDEFIRLMPGQLYIVNGIPSSGKSEWLDQLMLNSVLMHRWKWAVYSPENMPVSFHFQKLAEKFIGKPMFGHTGNRMTDMDIIKAGQHMDENFKLILPEDGGLTIDAILDKMRVCIVRFGVKGIVIDPYNEVEHKRPQHMSETEYVSEFISKVRNFARMYGVLAFVVAHPTKLMKKDDGTYPVPTPYDISGSAHWRNKADCCISVWRNFAATDGEVEIHIQKVRNKNIGQLGAVKLYWRWDTGRFLDSPPSEEYNNSRSYMPAEGGTEEKLSFP